MHPLEQLEYQLQMAAIAEIVLKKEHGRLVPHPGLLERLVANVKDFFIPEIANKFDVLLTRPDKDDWGGIQAFVDMAKALKIFKE